MECAPGKNRSKTGMGGSAAASVGGGRVGVAPSGGRSRVPESSLEPKTARVGDLVGPPAPIVPFRLSVGHARKIAALKSATLLLVEQDGQLVGLVDKRDLDRAADDEPLDRCIRRLVLGLAPTAPVERARELLLKHRLSALPVVAGMFVIGCVSREAVERALAGRARPPVVTLRAAA